MLRNESPFSRHCEEIIASLPIRFPFELRAFLTAVGDQRGVPIELWRMTPTRMGRSGMVLRTYRRIYLLVASRTDSVHLTHIAFHELGHLLLGHSSDLVCATGSTRQAAEGRQEEQAEEFAYALYACVRSGAREHRVRASRPRAQLRAAFGPGMRLGGANA